MLADFNIAPMDKGYKSLGRHVARIIKIIRKSGLRYHLHSMGTTVEGGSSRVFALIKKCHMEMTRHSKRVYTVIKIDDRKGATGRLDGKVKSVERYLK
jgi:uncharacterized protein (TIGR00106 family)